MTHSNIKFGMSYVSVYSENWGKNGRMTLFPPVFGAFCNVTFILLDRRAEDGYTSFALLYPYNYTV
jgi:hypothetical protein